MQSATRWDRHEDPRTLTVTTTSKQSSTHRNNAEKQGTETRRSIRMCKLWPLWSTHANKNKVRACMLANIYMHTQPNIEGEECIRVGDVWLWAWYWWGVGRRQFSKCASDLLLFSSFGVISAPMYSIYHSYTPYWLSIHSLATRSQRHYSWWPAPPHKQRLHEFALRHEHGLSHAQLTGGPPLFILARSESSASKPCCLSVLCCERQGYACKYWNKSESHKHLV